MQAHKNNIGFLRLLFSSLVIVGHAPEMTDGNRVHEPLTVIFHTVSLGELSVDAFFLLSGYLIAKSMARTKSLQYYLERRILRIYPGFIVAYLLCVFVLGPIVGAQPWKAVALTLVRMLFLQDPMAYHGQLLGLHYPALNGSMWTIVYEFRCYLLVAFFGVTGILARKMVVLALMAAGILASVAVTYPTIYNAINAVSGDHHWIMWVIGDPIQTIRLTTVFLIGTAFYVFDDIVRKYDTPAVATVCAGCALILMYRNPHIAGVAMASLGAVFLFWLAFKADIGPIQRINDDWDISYGVYLYGWPIAIFVLWTHPAISYWLLAAVTLPLSFLFGAASWWGVEKWTKDIKRSRSVT